jgi:hypothetical protein
VKSASEQHNPHGTRASDDASLITVATFLVDGGISAAYVTPR